MILNAFYKLIWSIFVQGPLQLISSFNTVLNYLTRGVVGDLMFGSKQEFSFQNIPMAFWYFAITALCLFSLIFLQLQWLKFCFKMPPKQKQNLLLLYKMVVKRFFLSF